MPGAPPQWRPLTSVLVNNLPAASLLAARRPPHPYSLLVGLNVGPNLFVTGSLAWVLWLRAARGAGGAPDIRRASLLGLASAPLAIAVAVAVLVSGAQREAKQAPWLYTRDLVTRLRVPPVQPESTPSAPRSTSAASRWARFDTAAVVTSAEPWKVPGNECSSTDTPAWSSRRA